MGLFSLQERLGGNTQEDLKRRYKDYCAMIEYQFSIYDLQLVGLMEIELGKRGI